MEFNLSEEELDYDFLGEDLNHIDLHHTNDAVIFLVDAQALKFINSNINEDNLSIAVNSYSSVLKSKIIGGLNDKCGLIFYNTVE